MYGPPPAAVVPVAPRRGGISGPLAAMLCLGVILFLIAATIVLALIPVYLPSRNAQQTGTTKTYYFVLSPNQTLGDDGILSNSASITSLEQAISSALGLNVNSFVIDGNVVIATVNSGKRRRRGFGLERSERSTQQNLYCHGRFLHKFCGSCLIVQTIITFFAEIFYGGVLVPLEFVCQVYPIVISVPATVGSSTSTAAVTAAVTAAANTTTGTSGISG
jgi:hypothetical protein